MSRLVRILCVSAAMLGALSAAAPALAQDIAITNATVAIGDGSAPLPGATVVVRAGKIVAAGVGIPVPGGVRTIDGTGKWVTPGLVVAVTDLGLINVESDSTSNDSIGARSPFSAALDVAPAINPDSQHVLVSRAGGITRAAVVPGGSNALFAGQGAIIDLGADPDPINRARAFQYVELGEAAARQAGGSRVAAYTQLRNALAEARELARRTGTTVGGADQRLAPGAPERPGDALLNRFDAAALIAVVNGAQPLYIHAERVADLRAALALPRDFPQIRLVIVGAAEGWRIAPEIAAAGIPVIARPLTDLPTDFEHIAATQSNVGRMAAAGVKVAIGAFGDQPRYAPQYAGNLAALTRLPGASGLDWGHALAAISSVPAEILGMGDRIGSLRPGRAGDVVIWDGDPLEAASGVEQVFIDGVEQPLTNHQTKLRDRYRDPAERTLPKAYDW